MKENKNKRKNRKFRPDWIRRTRQVEVKRLPQDTIKRQVLAFLPTETIKIDKCSYLLAFMKKAERRREWDRPKKMKLK